MDAVEAVEAVEVVEVVEAVEPRSQGGGGVSPKSHMHVSKLPGSMVSRFPGGVPQSHMYGMVFMICMVCMVHHVHL